VGTGIGGNGNWWKRKLMVMGIGGNRKVTLLVETCISRRAYQDTFRLERCCSIIHEV